MISAFDGDLKDQGEDKFRIKIWDMTIEDEELSLVYDNEFNGEEEDADPSTVIGGGSIVIHTKDDKKSPYPEHGDDPQNRPQGLPDRQYQ